MTDDPEPLPEVTVEFTGPLAEPVVVIPAATLSASAAIDFAQAIFNRAADACRDARFDVAGRG